MRAIDAAAVLAAAVLCGCAPLPARDDPWTGHDKLQHLGYSAVIAAAATAAAKNQGADHCDAARIGFGLSFSAGVAKELYDANVRRIGWSWRDLVMDGVGALGASLAVAPCP